MKTLLKPKSENSISTSTPVFKCPLYLTVVQCADIAENFLKKHNVLARNQLPTNIENLALKAGFDVIPTANLLADHGTRGLFSFDNSTGEPYIRIDLYHYQNQPDQAQFTMAEELAHIILHRDIFSQIKTIDDRIALDRQMSVSDRELIEQQARRVASGLLLPPSIFNGFVMNYCSTNKKPLLEESHTSFETLADSVAHRLKRHIELSHWSLKVALHRWTPEPIMNTVIDRLQLSTSKLPSQYS